LKYEIKETEIKGIEIKENEIKNLRKATTEK
jgi:hypothetical protein